MDKKINVLVFPCGSENAIEIHNALEDVLNIEVYGASGRSDHGLHIFKNYIGNLPFIWDTDFLKEFIGILKKYKIDLIFPTHDDVVLFLAENQSKISSKIAVPGLTQARICRSKKLIYDLFKNNQFCPKIYDEATEDMEFPVFIKPDKGQGGKGTFLIKRDADLKKLAGIDFDKYVVSEYLPGEELTVDCFTDRHGQLRFVGPRTRGRIFGGISVNSKAIVANEEILRIAKEISNKVGMRGLWFFQLKKDQNKQYKLLEVSARVSSTMSLYRELGINFPLLTVYDWFEYDVEIIKNEYDIEVDRSLMNRYNISMEFNTVYIDFDDTITKGGKVNINVIKLLYHFKNRDKKIILITKHEFDLAESLNELAISSNLFSKIIHIKPDDEKYKYISETEKVIFIDNAFNERKKVLTNLNIPVFDIDAIDSLIDWKE